MDERARVEQLPTLLSADVDVADESAGGELFCRARSVRGAIAGPNPTTSGGVVRAAPTSTREAAA